ncbi:alpha/beta hydrolase family esterase [Streptomyces chilikensis]|uniref:extracellular catalytic domain type 1 short-chain-length polyhydroxyalkanoate depolymerase n=1 Tax=Streptomyces chilikensis TaxID=1194079 RepID=UPI001409B650|nr:PHB depolymerase family esterase [Streptomyces chilikensis]
MPLPGRPRSGARPGGFGLTAVLALLLALFAAPTPASAASLTQVTGFGTNPGNLQMYAYVPDGLPAGAPLVVAMHGCTQSAPDYHAHSGWAKYADLYGFAVVYPHTSSANNANSCFNWFQSSDHSRGQGEALSVKQMVDHAIGRYGSDRSRVFVTGLSAGGAMTAAMLAAYPDVFAGGSIASGIPAGCATGVANAYTCMYNATPRTPKQWGDAVRSASGGWTGPWPRVAVWHGTSDTTVVPANATQSRDQWTDVWGLGQTPSSTASLPGNTTQAVYTDARGVPAVTTFTVSGMGHGTAVDPGSGTQQCGTAGTYYLDTICSSYYTALFWGLDGGSAGPGVPGALPAPTGLTAGQVTESGLTLSWNAVAGAASYEIHRGGSRVGTVTGTSYTDSGLSPGTAYTYTVAAVDSAGTAGARSAAVTATTTGGDGGFEPRCHTASNYAHVQAGRARHSGGYAYANGSGQNMGLYNTFYSHTLEETSPGHFVISDSGCPS